MTNSRRSVLQAGSGKNSSVNRMILRGFIRVSGVVFGSLSFPSIPVPGGTAEGAPMRVALPPRSAIRSRPCRVRTIFCHLARAQALALSATYRALSEVTQGAATRRGTVSRRERGSRVPPHKHGQNISYMDAEIIGSYFEEILQTLRPFSVATLELFPIFPGQVFGSKQDPFISALA